MRHVSIDPTRSPGFWCGVRSVTVVGGDSVGPLVLSVPMDAWDREFRIGTEHRTTTEIAVAALMDARRETIGAH